MGIDIHVRVCYYDSNDNKYKEIKLYQKKEGQLKPISLFSGRNCELFGYLNGAEDSYIPISRINTENGSIPQELLEEVLKCKNNSGYYDFLETNLADLKLYLFKHPKVRDWDEEDVGYKDNPVKYFVERIDAILSIASIPSYFDSEIRILYWFDR